MTDSKNICCVSIILVVLLRLSIGWQFLYEGLWKINTLSTPTPWSAEGYLRNAQGPFRNTFRNMTGDPNDLEWLDKGKVADKWDDWTARFTAHYQLDEKQSADLSKMLNGAADYRVPLDALPEGVVFDANLSKQLKFDVSKVISFDAKAKRLICPGNWRMLAKEREALLALAKIDESAPEAKQNSVKAYRDAVVALYNRATDPKTMSLKDRLAVAIIGNNAATDPSVTERTFALFNDPPRDVKVYQEKIAEYEANLAKAKQQSAMQFPQEHLQKQWYELQQLRGKLIGPVKALDAELKVAGQKLLTAEQLVHGPVRLPASPMDRINKQTIWGLTVFGVLLLIGLGTRFAAIGGAVMLTMFYLAMPPWPGVPDAPGPEHSLIVNKNFIEIMALLAIAALPTGQWFGLDRIVAKFRCRKKSCCGITTSSTSNPTA
ncbi:MAG: DoxX family protein [Planctomycetes bacterium]|nr:DoxX family protein [Planctomycetota bacterium]